MPMPTAVAGIQRRGSSRRRLSTACAVPRTSPATEPPSKAAEAVSTRPATAVGMGIGLLLGATVVGYGTSLRELAAMGALTGAVLGPAQALALPARTRRRWLWAAAMPSLWALGWTVMTLIGVDVEEQLTLFGASGALTFSAASGALLHALLPPDGLGR